MALLVRLTLNLFCGAMYYIFQQIRLEVNLTLFTGGFFYFCNRIKWSFLSLFPNSEMLNET